MSKSSSGGFLNFAYHDSETLELEKRFPSKGHHTNPYERDIRADSHHSSNDRAGGGGGIANAALPGWQHDGWRGGESIAMNLISNQSGSPSWHHNHSHTTFQISTGSGSVRLPSSFTGNMSMRWRGNTTRRMSVFPDAEPPPLAPTEDALQKEMETEEQNLVKDLVDMSTRERIDAIRDLPMSFQEKKSIRNQVLAFKSATQSHHFTCFRDFSENVSVTLRRWGYALRSARQTLQLWHGTMKEIGGRFGTSVLTYFLFLKWLLMFNVVSFLINFGFITIPLLVYDHSPNIPEGVSFRGLELLTGAGYFNYSVLYYGSYSNETLVGLVAYDMKLAYFFTISLYMVLCGIALIFSMAKSFKKNYVLADPASNSAWQLLCTWDFSVTNERAVKQRKNNLSVQLKESLSEGAQKEMLTLSEKMKHFGVHLGFWLLSTGLAFGCGAGIYFLCQYEQQSTTDESSWTPLQEAQTLLVPFIVSLMNLVVPLFYALFKKFEVYSSQRKQIYALVVRNVLFKMSILAVLCYYWMHVVAKKFSCWESMVGQALYRLVFFDFLFLLLGSFFGEFLSNLIGRKLLPSLGVPEFDVARNVFELIYAQTLSWIGIYFSPLLPLIQILKCFILFYVKKVSLAQNCQPPQRTGRAAQMQTILIALLFFPSFVGALSIVAYTAWSLTPSEQCGPFRGQNNTFSAVGVWIEDLQQIPGSQWAVWIYHHVIRSEVFYFFLALIVIIIIYIFWQVTQGRKLLIAQLRQQIINEGKDKSFLLDKLQNLQKSNQYVKQKHPNKRTNWRSKDLPKGDQSEAMAQALLAKQMFEEEERSSSGGVPVPADIPTSSALLQAMLARQRAEDGEFEVHRMPDMHLSSSSAVAQAMQARQASLTRESDQDYSGTGFFGDTSSAVVQAMRARQTAEDSLSYSGSDVMTQVMQARQRAEESLQDSAPAGPSALIQAMLARQQAQNEYDDGY
ncbi:transmembrane channel-like protein 5 [Takifugu flavidus]|uniref:transmembrane channel-like protein 5 n=1 Tax=Takifugu flavidus TaxID=433684 RepID=UPI002544759B|nr:transmembrane channel-like protein 5 [Takifugu flavidus]XP_056891022.1 transmembrane channel-like protein 5 [Takifugu flavidus]